MARKRIPKNVETNILARSARRCSLCLHLRGDLNERLGQIAHLDHDSSNAAEDNLVFLCLEHHSLFDSKTSQHKNYQESEIKTARKKLYALVADGTYLNSSKTHSAADNEADRRILREFLERVPSVTSIAFLRNADFEGIFDTSYLDDINLFLHFSGGPEHEFLDEELEIARRNFRIVCQQLFDALGAHTQPTNRIGWLNIPSDWRYENSVAHKRALDAMYGAAELVCLRYDELVRLARRKLAF